jgi:predicted transcriptional regulator of viral defense system
VNQILAHNRSAWGLPESITVGQFINALGNAKLLHELRLEFPTRNVVRYVWDDPSPHEIVQSINRDGYFSHFTAMRFHGLTDQLPTTIYLNVEQQLVPGGGEIDQQSIDRAFRRPCRVTHNTAVYLTSKIFVLNGGNTKCLGVGELVLGNGSQIRVTGIERTLIDAVVRPVYSGGVFEVARAYTAAQGRASIRSLAKMLHTLDYTYPYHQAIGFYLEKAGYDRSEVDLMRERPIEHDFYLDHAMRQTEYNSRWRLFVPKGF